VYRGIRTALLFCILVFVGSCISVDVSPYPRLRVDDGEGHHDIVYHEDVIEINSGEAVRIEVLVEEGTQLYGRSLDQGELSLDIDNEAVVGVFPHWVDGMWVICGIEEGTAVIEVAGGRFEIEVSD